MDTKNNLGIGGRWNWFDRYKKIVAENENRKDRNKITEMTIWRF